jgi:hypothetical protein
MSARDQGQAAAAPRAQNAQQEDSPVRKVISVLQVCTSPLVITLTHPHTANSSRLCSDEVW